MSEQAAPVSWWRPVSKALAALAAALVVNAAIIYAAVEDGHITMTEGVTIVLAVIGALGIPGAVYYAPKNTPKPLPPHDDTPLEPA